MEMVIRRADGCILGGKRIVGPSVLVPESVLSVKLFKESRVDDMELPGADPDDGA